MPAVSKDSRLKNRNGLLKISELAKATGESCTTIKYYVSQGLVDIACKTSVNMAWYDESAIERINLIRTLQKKRFYPLSYIRQILQVNGGADLDLDLMDAIYKYNPKRKGNSISVEKASHQFGIEKEKIQTLADNDVIRIENGLIDEVDCDILRLVKMRMDDGLSFGHTLDAFCAYQKSLTEAVALDIDSMILKSLFMQDLSPEKMVRMIRESDKSLTEYIEIKRQQLNMNYGAERLRQVSDFSNALTSYIYDSLIPKAKLRFGSRNVSSAFIPVEVANLMERSGKISVTVSLHLIMTAYQYCASLALSSSPSEDMDCEMYLKYGIAYGFFGLLPDILISRERLEISRSNFPDFEEFGIVIENLKGIHKRV